VDRKDADTSRVLNETFDLFIELGASDAQADFPVVYTIATHHQAGLDPGIGPDLQPLFATILRSIPAPVVDMEKPLQMLVTTLDYDNYRGQTAIGRIFAGEMLVGQPVLRLANDGESYPEVIRYLYVQEGLERVEVERARAGDIVAVAGLEAISIGETLADPENPHALPGITVEAPTVRMSFGVNTSPFSGREGRWATSRKLRERLFNETRSNLSLRVEETVKADTFLVSGRGELHLAILIETMRREGYEFQVSRPEVILKEDLDGETLEPFEEVTIEVPPDAVGTVIENLGKRRGELQHMMETAGGTNLLTFIVPSRGLFGFRYQFMTATRGLGMMTQVFHGYAPSAGALAPRSRGSLVAWETGTTTTFGLKNAEERGTLFLGPGVEVYAGMVVGEHQRPGDLEVNVVKAKHLTNMRNSIRDIEVRLVPYRDMSLDQAIEYLADDELLEVTPDSLRIRKRVLDAHQRGREAKRARELMGV